MDAADISTALGLIVAGDPSNGDHDNGSLGNNNNNDSVLSRATLEDLIRRSPIFRISSSNFSSATQALLIAAFSVLIAFGSAGNSLVLYVVLANRHMRTPRNLLIANLAASDLVLCLFTQPFNLMKVSTHSWNLGTAMCKLVPMAAGTNVFVSTISITAIALDRFHLIVHPTDRDILLMKSGSSLALALIWILSILMATPMLVFSTTRDVEPIAGLTLYEVCVENPDHHYAKAAYSVASMIIQYLVPIAILSVAHAQICKKLRYRMTAIRITRSKSSSTTAAAVVASRTLDLSAFQARRLQAEATRKRRTNLLLVMIAVVFALSWMPLNVINVIADFEQTLILSFDKNGVVFAVCHLLVLSSACANPVLYGWLNDNFRQEFVRALCGRCAPRQTTTPLRPRAPEVHGAPEGCCWSPACCRFRAPSDFEISREEGHEMEGLRVTAAKVSSPTVNALVVESERDPGVKVEPQGVKVEPSSMVAIMTYGSTNP